MPLIGDQGEDYSGLNFDAKYHFFNRPIKDLYKDAKELRKWGKCHFLSRTLYVVISVTFDISVFAKHLLQQQQQHQTAAATTSGRQELF